MQELGLVAVLSSSDPTQRPSAFETIFKVEKTVVREEYGVSNNPRGGYQGCRVPTVSVNIHCSQPHLECAAHILPQEYNWTVSDAITNGTVEDSVLITPHIETLGESGDTYPIGDVGDYVVSKRAVSDALSEVGFKSEGRTSLIMRVPESHLPCYRNTSEIQSWPYLTIECANLIREKFDHIRTNLPSVERVESNGGMWSHEEFFGLRGIRGNHAAVHPIKRTIGELFCIPGDIMDGRYKLICPFIEMGLDCAITVPLLFLSGQEIA